MPSFLNIFGEWDGNRTLTTCQKIGQGYNIPKNTINKQTNNKTSKHNKHKHKQQAKTSCKNEQLSNKKQTMNKQQKKKQKILTTRAKAKCSNIANYIQ